MITTEPANREPVHPIKGVEGASLSKRRGRKV